MRVRSPRFGSSACRSIIAFFRMSAAVPWMGMFTVSRSAWLRIWKLRLVRFGTSRRRPNIVFTTPVVRAFFEHAIDEAAHFREAGEVRRR